MKDPVDAITYANQRNAKGCDPPTDMWFPSGSFCQGITCVNGEHPDQTVPTCLTGLLLQACWLIVASRAQAQGSRTAEANEAPSTTPTTPNRLVPKLPSTTLPCKSRTAHRSHHPPLLMQAISPTPCVSVCALRSSSPPSRAGALTRRPRPAPCPRCTTTPSGPLPAQVRPPGLMLRAGVKRRPAAGGGVGGGIPSAISA